MCRARVAEELLRRTRRRALDAGAQRHRPAGASTVLIFPAERGTKDVLRVSDVRPVFHRATIVDLSETFRSHAQECQWMASFTHDAADKATWSQMAKRWLSCAEYYEDQHARHACRDAASKGVFNCTTSPRITSQRAGRTLRFCRMLWRDADATPDHPHYHAWGLGALDRSLGARPADDRGGVTFRRLFTVGGNHGSAPALTRSSRPMP